MTAFMAGTWRDGGGVCIGGGAERRADMAGDSASSVLSPSFHGGGETLPEAEFDGDGDGNADADADDGNLICPVSPNLCTYR